MQTTALQSTDSPLGTSEVERLAALVRELTREELLWTSGYLAGLAAARGETAASAPVSSPLPARAATWTVLYGSQTGHGRSVAERLGDALRGDGLGVELASMAVFKPSQLKKLEHLILVVSTHGDGDPPDDAIELYEYLT